MDIPAFHSVTAHKEHECCECHERILPKERCWIQYWPDARQRRWKNVFTCSHCRPQHEVPAQPTPAPQPIKSQQLLLL